MAKRKSRRGHPALVILIVLLAAALIAFFSIRAEIGGGRKTGEQVAVTIPMGSSTTDIADVLKEAGLIRNTTLFRLYSRVQDGDGHYQYGDFALEKGSSYSELIAALCSTVSYRESITLALPEGMNAFQMAAAAEEAGLCTAEEYLAAANRTDYDFDFMDEISTDSRKPVVLDGFLFPDTYAFFPEDTAEDIVMEQLANFEKKVLTEENLRALGESGLAMEEWVALAAIIQKESASVEEMYNVSSVFWNRLNDNSTYPLLQSDTTNSYINDYIRPYYNGNPPQEVLDAYDTYGSAGLPIGAIADAGTDALDAALHPNDTPYYFFVTDVEYNHYYGRTYSEHLANIEKARAVNVAHGINGLVG